MNVILECFNLFIAVVNVHPTLDKTFPIANDQCIELSEGQSTEFTCIYNASTNPSVTITTWRFNGKLLEHNSSHYTIITQYNNSNRVLSRLTLLSVSHDNTGTYTCQCAFNSSVVDKEVVSEAANFCLNVKSGQHYCGRIFCIYFYINRPRDNIGSGNTDSTIRGTDCNNNADV